MIVSNLTTTVEPPHRYRDRKRIKSRLCLQSEIPYGTNYLMLSHYWGGQVPLQLLTTNFEAMRNGICCQALPKTFQDALLLT
jgi:hypothetical protein